MVVKPEDLDKVLDTFKEFKERDRKELKELEKDVDRGIERSYRGGSVNVLIPPIRRRCLREEFERIYSEHWDVKYIAFSDGQDRYRFTPKRKAEEPKR